MKASHRRTITSQVDRVISTDPPAGVRFAPEAGLPHVRFHDLRHAHATLMAVAGVRPKVVSERLGHASIGITLDTYSHVLPPMQSDAVGAFDELSAG